MQQQQQLYTWYNEPQSCTIEATNKIIVKSSAKSDYWRKTHYGFVRDNGNFFYTSLTNAEQFTISCQISGKYEQLYDQAGIMIRYNDKCWLKTGIEFFDEKQHVSAVYTNDFSDWSVVPCSDSNCNTIFMRVKRDHECFTSEYSFDGINYTMLRLGYLNPAEKEDTTIQVGIMVASPTSETGFETVFENLQLQVVGQSNSKY